MMIEEILNTMHKQYGAFLHFYMNFSPLFAKGKIKIFSQKKAGLYSIILQIFLVLLKIFCWKAPPKYIFQGLRHTHLMKVLKPSDVMVIGGRNELIYCQKMGYRFHWAGYLDRCFELHYFANKSSPLSNALKFIERYFTPNAGVTHYIFLWEDTQPIGLSLSLGLKDITGMNVVCVAHGYEFAHNPERVGMDGKNCKFNLVYDSKQAEFYNDSTTFILGLPYEVEPASNIKSKIVLVEHTGMDSGIEYINSVYHFIKLYKVLENAGYEIIYRPRPGSDTSYAMSIFKNVNNEDKSNLFSEGRMIFIGFSSTLLYEAKAFGNIVIGLDTSEFVDKRNFDVHLTLLPHDYKKLPTIVSQIMDNGFEMFIEKVDGLSLRFYKCLESIDNCKMSHE